MVKNVAVVYKSKYGSTEKYAHWIAEAVKADVFCADTIAVNSLSGYDTLVYCGGIYAGKILGFSLIRKNYHQIKDRKLLVVAVGVTTKKDSAVKEIRDHNFTADMQVDIPLFLLRGGLNYPQMGLIDRTIMFLLVNYLRFKKRDKTDDDAKGLIATFGQVVDFTNRQEIAPIVHAIEAE